MEGNDSLPVNLGAQDYQVYRSLSLSLPLLASVHAIQLAFLHKMVITHGRGDPIPFSMLLPAFHSIVTTWYMHGAMQLVCCCLHSIHCGIHL